MISSNKEKRRRLAIAVRKLEQARVHFVAVLGEPPPGAEADHVVPSLDVTLHHADIATEGLERQALRQVAAQGCPVCLGRAMRGVLRKGRCGACGVVRP